MREEQFREAMQRSFHTRNLTPFDEQIVAWAVPGSAISVAELASKLRDLAEDLCDLANDIEGGAS